MHAGSPLPPSRRGALDSPSFPYHTFLKLVPVTSYLAVVEPLTPAQREVLNEKIKHMTDMPSRFQEKHAGMEVG